MRAAPPVSDGSKKANNGMSEAGNAARNPPEGQSNAPTGGQSRVTELKVSGHLMTLDSGLFCVFQVPGSPTPNDRSGLPGVRISMPPGSAGRPDAVSISTFRDDGWLDSQDAAALVRVAKGPAQVLVTVYQSPAASPESAPRLQVMRLGPEQGGEAEGRRQWGAGLRDRRLPWRTPMSSPTFSAPAICQAGSANGSAREAAACGSKASAWHHTTALSRPMSNIRPCSAAVGCRPGSRGAVCGSRGMALPLLGLKVRLRARRQRLMSVAARPASSMQRATRCQAMCGSCPRRVLVDVQVVTPRRMSRASRTGDCIDPKRVLFPGRLEYATYLAMLQRSDAHVYLTYPFVASWSLREALATGCVVVASRTPPTVREFVLRSEGDLGYRNARPGGCTAGAPPAGECAAVCGEKSRNGGLLAAYEALIGRLIGG